MGEKLVVNPSFDICCPKCKDNYTIQVQEEIKCKKCQTSFAGKKFFGKNSCSTISKLLLGASLGVGGTIYTENASLEQKIPIPVKNTYNLVQSCISEHRIDNTYYTQKIRDNCLCAVEKISEISDIRTLKEISTDQMKNYYNQCTNQ